MHPPEAEAPGSPPGLAPAPLTPLCGDPGARGPLRDDVISSPVKERTKGVSQRPSLPTRAGASATKERRGSAKDRPKGVQGLGLPGRRPHPGSGAASSPRLCPAGGRTRARGREVGKGPQEAGLRLGADLTPPAPSSPRGAALAPNPRHLSQLGQQRSLRTEPRWRERAPPERSLEKKNARRGRNAERADRPTCPATNSSHQVLPKMRTESAECQGAARRAMVPPRGRGGSARRDPFSEAGAASLAGCGGWPPGVRLRGRAALDRRVR